MKYIMMSVLLIASLIGADTPCNAEPPLMMIKFIHQYPGTLFMALAEAFLLIWLLKTKPFRTLLVIMAANYCSFYVALELLKFIDHTFSSQFICVLQLDRILAWNGLMFGIFTSIMVLIQIPFIFWVLEAKNKRRITAVKTSACLQLLSCCLIVPFYCFTSNLSLLNNTKLETTPSFAKLKDAQLSYFSPDDNCVWQCNLDGSCVKKLSKPTNLEVYKNNNEHYLDSREFDKQKITAATGIYSNYGVHLSASPNGNLIASFGIETPFAKFFPTNLTMLPGEQAIFQLEPVSFEYHLIPQSSRKSMILLFDLQTYQLALLGYGEVPKVTLKNQMS